MRVHLNESEESDFGQRVEKALPAQISFSRGTVASDADFEVLIAGRPSESDLDASPALRAVVVPFAGIPPETKERLLARPHISLHNLHHNAVPTAELAIGLMFAAAKRVVPMDRCLRGQDWRPRYEKDDSMLLTGKTALVLGHGAVGREIAQRCRGLGLEVIAVRRSGPVTAESYPVEALPHLLPRAHVVFVATPLTDATRGLLGAEQLELLPRGALLINVARGPVVDETALYESLKGGHLGAAGLDVWYSYPKDEEQRVGTEPSQYPFGELDQVVLSPHRAGHCEGIEQLRAEHLVQLLVDGIEQDELPNRVRLERGY